MAPSHIKLYAKDLVMLQDGTKTAIMGELWKRLSEAVEYKYMNPDRDATSSSSTAASDEDEDMETLHTAESKKTKRQTQ